MPKFSHTLGDTVQAHLVLEIAEIALVTAHMLSFTIAYMLS